MEPVEVVKRCYEAFKCGDIPELLRWVSPDVSWTDAGFPDVPYAGVRSGHDGVADFLRSLRTHVEFSAFEPKQFLASGADVVVFGEFAGVDRYAGGRFRSDWAMRWRVENGLVTLHQSYVDTCAIARALDTVRPILVEAAG